MYCWAAWGVWFLLRFFVVFYFILFFLQWVEVWGWRCFHERFYRAREGAVPECQTQWEGLSTSSTPHGDGKPQTGKKTWCSLTLWLQCNAAFHVCMLYMHTYCTYIYERLMTSDYLLWDVGPTTQQGSIYTAKTEIILQRVFIVFVDRMSHFWSNNL